MSDDLLDTLTRHQIFIQRLAGGQVNQAGIELEKLIAEVERKLEGDLTDFQQFRYQRILNDLKLYAAEVYQEIGASTEDFANNFIEYESEFSTAAFTQATGVDFDLPNPVQLQSAYLTDVMALQPGRSAKSFGQLISVFGQQAQGQFLQVLRDGFALGRTSPQIVNDIKDHVSLKKDQVKTLIRTGTNHLAVQARNRTLMENRDILDGYEWVATLDSRTTFICMSRDGLIYPISNNDDRSPKPPAHFGCRSTIVPKVKKGMEIEGETFRPSDGSTGKRPVSGKLNYEQWLRKQSKEFQIEVLGKERQRLFAQQRLPLSRFIDSDGRTLTLQELRDRDITFNQTTIQQAIRPTLPEPKEPPLKLKGVIGNRIEDVERRLNKDLTPLTLKVARKLPKPNEIQSVPERKGAYYDSGNVYVQTNLKPDGTDYHAVTAHEYGHHIDYEIGKKLGNRYKSWSETDPRFQEAFKLDRKALGLVPTKTRKSVAYEKMQELFKIKQVEGRRRWDFDELPTKGNLCDILDGFTGGICRGNLGGFGHAKSYWKIKGMKEKEAFANMYSIYGTPDWKNVEKIAPNMAKRFVQILEEIAK